MALLSGLSSGVGDWDRVDEVVGGLFTSHVKLPEQLKKSSSNSVPKWNNNVTWKTALRVVRMLFLLLVDFFQFFLVFFSLSFSQLKRTFKCLGVASSRKGRDSNSS